MKKGKRLTGLALALLLLAGCGAQQKETPSATGDTSNVADASEMTTVEDVVEEGMVPVSGAELNDGTYSVVVDSSSSMFRIEKAVLHVKDGSMTATLTMSGKSYLYVFPGTALGNAAGCIWRSSLRRKIWRFLDNQSLSLDLSQILLQNTKLQQKCIENRHL